MRTLLLAACAALIALPAHGQPKDSFSRTPSRTTSESVKAASPTRPGAPDQASGGTRLPANFDQLDDRATLVLGGKTFTAGEVRRAVNAEIARGSGPPRTVKAAKAAGSALPVPQQTMATSIRTSGVGKNAQIEMGRSPLVTSRVQAQKTDDVRKLNCTNQGPPELVVLSGALTPGGKATLSGYCFGNRTGRVEIIGQFPGGKLRFSFLSWNMTDIEIAIPADIRGAADHAAAVTVIAADGRRSPALQVSFRAARERVAVPAARWFPAANFTQSSLKDDIYPNNPTGAGQSAPTVRIQRECALTDVEAYVTLGTVTRIEGFVEGGNEANLKVFWGGACIQKRTLTNILGAQSLSFESACAIAYEMRATAECPAGVAP